MEGRLEVMRTLLLDTAARAAIDDPDVPPPTPGELKDLARGLLSIEQAG